MAKDIFGFDNAEFGGVFSADEAKFTISGINDSMLIQNFQLQYQQQFQPVYEFGSNRVWYSRAHAAGSLTINRIVGGADIARIFGGGGCTGRTCTVTVGDGVCGGTTGGSRTLTLTGVFLTAIQWSGQAGTAYVTEGVSFMFASAS